MTDQFRPRPEELDRLEAGSLASHLMNFAALLSKQRYCRMSGWRKVRLVAALGQWLARRHLTLAELSEQTLESFLKPRRKKRNHSGGDHSALVLLLRQLRELGVTPSLQARPARHWRDRIRQDYQQFLFQERSLAPVSVDHYLRIIDGFLTDRFPQSRGRLNQLRLQDITTFVLQHRSFRGHGLLRLTTTALRSFLGFLFQTEWIRTNLATAVPKVAL